MNQITKERILESWIMVERLSEGNIKKDDTKLFRFDDLKDDDYYSLFMNKIDENKLRKYKKRGIILYIDLFEFKTVIDFLRMEYNLKPPVEEIRYGYKFGLALYFDKDLNFQPKMTFFTFDGYIRYFKKMPQAEQFQEYEEELKTKLCQIFEIDEDKDDKESSENNAKEQSPVDPAKFNTAIKKVLELHSPKQNCITADFKFYSILKQTRPICTPFLSAISNAQRRYLQIIWISIFLALQGAALTWTVKKIL